MTWSSFLVAAAAPSAVSVLGLIALGWHRGGLLVFPHRVYPWGPRTKKSPLVQYRCPQLVMSDYSGGYRDDARKGQCSYTVRAHTGPRNRPWTVIRYRCPIHHCDLVKA